MARRRLARLGPIEFPIRLSERAGRIVGTVPGLPVRERGSTARVVRDRLAKRLLELAEIDPFILLRAVEAHRRETLTVEFEGPRAG